MSQIFLKSGTSFGGSSFFGFFFDIGRNSVTVS